MRRCGLQCLGEEGSLFALDGELKLPKDSYSHGLRERLASEVARGSFDEAARAIETTTGGKIPKGQAEELTAKVSQDFEAFYEACTGQGPEETVDPLVFLSEDGKGIVMRREELREGTKRAAERDSCKLNVQAAHSLQNRPVAWRRSSSGRFGRCHGACKNSHLWALKIPHPP